MKNLLTVLILALAVGCGTANKMGDKLGAESQKMGDEAVDTAKEEATEAIKVDIVATALTNGNFTTLVAALEAAELTDTLRGTGPFTVFAPTDAAFEDLPKGVVDNLMKAEAKDELKKLLLTHVLAGKVMAADASTMNAQTLGGATEPVTVGEDGSVSFGGSKISTADIDCTNGVIHVIDTVVMPGKAPAIAEEAAAVAPE